MTHAQAQKLLRDALGDPTLTLALAASGSAGFVDAAGEPLELPAGGAGPATTVLVADERPIAAVIHDPLLDVDVSRVEGLTAMVLMLLENARLLSELQISRRRLLAFIQRDRIRLERDLHDGAAQRLIAMQIRLESLRDKVGQDSELAGELSLISAQGLAALDEVRAVGDGIYPTVLQDFGLPTALQSAAFFLPLEIQVRAEEVGRLDPSLETTIYFCAIEALRNVAAHAGANARATVVLRRASGAIEFESRTTARPSARRLPGARSSQHRRPRRSAGRNGRGTVEAGRRHQRDRDDPVASARRGAGTRLECLPRFRVLRNGYEARMPMLRSCSFPDCETLTLSPYCVEHEQLVAGLEADCRAQAVVTDEPMARETAVQPAPAA